MHHSIKAKHKKARLDKNKTVWRLLSNLLGDLNIKAKANKVDTISDKEVIEIINTWVKRTNQNIKLFKDMPEAREEAEFELAIYTSLLPPKLTHKDIKSIIIESNLDSIPRVMQHFSANYLGRYTSKEVIALFNNMG